MKKVHLIEFFEDTAAKFPLKPAVIDAELTLTFDELRKRAKALARSIEQFGPIRNQPIAIYLGDTCQGVSSIFAVLYTGNCYAPLDINNPPERILKILENLNPPCIISDASGKKSLMENGINIPILDIEQITIPGEDSEPIGFKHCIDTDPAYIIHTSGSTGLPKGVAISHLSVMDYILWAIETFEISEDEIIGNQAPLIFDNSTLDLYLMAFTGATLCLIPKPLFMFPIKLMEFINRKGINFVFWVPSVLINVANLKILDSIDLPGLRKVLFAGEVMPVKALNYWRKHLNKEVLFANLYGPTEITVDCTYHIVKREYDDNEILPIGKPRRNSDILILNDKNELCQTNEQGELCVRGSSLALGYWNNLERTNAVFVQNPLNPNYPEKIYHTGDLVYQQEDGEIIFVGRRDNQIKHLGYRIELGEIEHVIANSFENIIPCVLYDEQRKVIELFYEAPNEITPVDFRKKLSTRLSKYMIPGEFIRMEHLPHNASGKIDRTNLKKILLMMHPN